MLGLRPPPTAAAEYTLGSSRHPDVPVRVHWPTAQRPAPAETGGLPVLIYFYGGAWTLAGIDWLGWDRSYRERAADAGVIVIAVDYSHAPEVQFPAQPEQGWTVLEWAHGAARELGGDPDRLAIGGASSGGNLAAAVTLMNRDRHQRPIRLQLLEAPALDLTLGHVDAGGVNKAIPDVILRQMAARLVTQYLGTDRGLRRHPYASPMLARSHAGLPPAVVWTAELDPLRGDGEAYVTTLTRAGVPAVGVRMIGQTHTSGGLRSVVPAAEHLHRDVVSTCVPSTHRRWTIRIRCAPRTTGYEPA
ncbi:alpha/beta hydrolase [Naumannella halotolerans]|uniref:alpha/beta hydrolase n=1 Tax=Naumannella halotolerans TaxID=993414 RepID=UPI001AAE2BC6|nr:alpha/beta hydrolase [Naumannella halotolerans]